MQQLLMREKLTIVQAELSLDEIRTALRISTGDALAKFRDPRITSWFAEIWGERLFGYKKHLNSNHPGSDARIDLGTMGRFDISVRCFNKGSIKFQKSKHIGSGRHATQDDLYQAIESVERVVIVDLRQFPRLRFFPIDSKSLLRLIRLEKLTTSGITPNRFDAWIADAFETRVVEITLEADTEGLVI
jgi:hypothetical protein